MTSTIPPAPGFVRPRARSAIVAALLVISLAGIVPRSVAMLTSADSVTADFAADVLLPPTDLVATGGTTIALDWTASPSTWAAGYAILRATSESGPYTQIDTVTPGTTVDYVDSPGPGTYFYRVRAFYQDWLSVDAGPASATAGVPVVTTGFQDCVGGSNAAETTAAGDGNGYESNPARACGLDGLFAQDASSGTGGTQSCGTGATPDPRKDRHRWWGFALGLPAAVGSIDGIEVQAHLRLNNNGGTTSLCAQLSWDGGASWTAIQALDVAGGNDWTTYSFGGAADTWGRSWTLSELESANLRVRIIDAASQTTKSFQLDGIQLQVTYTP